MPKRGKKYIQAKKLVEGKLYRLEEAIPLVRKAKIAKFDEPVDVAFRLGVDPKHADQMVRGSVVLPHGTGKKVRVAVITSGEKLKEAEAAGAELVGAEDLVERIAGGFLDFDAVVATPDMMRHVGKLGKVLGPRGLMPNPKTGTVTPDVTKAIREIRAGKVDFRVDKTANLHVSIGRCSFGEQQLRENFLAILETVQKQKPDTAKGRYIRSVALSTTMGPSIRLDPVALEAK
jgi:large subunit ribosomal protein L1